MILKEQSGNNPTRQYNSDLHNKAGNAATTPTTPPILKICMQIECGHILWQYMNILLDGVSFWYQ